MVFYKKKVKCEVQVHDHSKFGKPAGPMVALQFLLLQMGSLDKSTSRSLLLIWVLYKIMRCLEIKTIAR